MKFLDLIQEKIPHFLQDLYRGDGFYAWSKENDLYNPQCHWGLANTVFAVKTIEILDKIHFQNTPQKDEIINFIKSFEMDDGTISDPLLQKKSFWMNKYIALRTRNFSNINGAKTQMAESRQAIVGLRLLNERPKNPYIKIPYNMQDLKSFLERLNWKNIWGASSHIGHEVFFLKMNAELFNYKVEESNVLIKYCFKKIETLQQFKDGLWYSNSASPREKINAAMKIFSTYNLFNDDPIPMSDKIIDYLLDYNSSEYYYDACDHLNAMYVMKYASKNTSFSYRKKDIEDYCEKSLKRCQKRFYPDTGGFSFLPDISARKYYGLTVTKPYKGPDIHGTFLFTWAVSLALSLLQNKPKLVSDILN